MGIVVKQHLKTKIMKIHSTENPKKPNWTKGAIVFITTGILSALCFLIGSYRPTRGGQITWEIVGGVLAVAAVGLLLYSFFASPKRKI